MLSKTIGTIQGKRILQGQDGKIFVEGGYGLLVNSIKIKEVGYIEGNKLLVELADGSEVGIMLEKNEVIRHDTREKVDEAIAA
jgi:hypothetical protein